MIKPFNYSVDDFKEYLDNQAYLSIALENLHSAQLIDSLLLLKFVTVEEIQQVLKEKYKITFAWLDEDMTPKELVSIADRYGIIFNVQTPQSMEVYIQVGKDLDEASLQVDVPNYHFNYIYIADSNYRIIKNNLNKDVLSFALLDFRPLLVFRRLILDCMYNGGTDIHFASFYVDKQPRHFIQYRIKREVVNSTFNLDYSVTQRIVQAAVSKLSTASAADLDSSQGVTTDIADLFGDGSCDLRLTGEQVSAGMYIVVAIQTLTTTTFSVSELGFPERDVTLIEDIAQKRTGLTLVTGEMRSGKNTTIFAMLNGIVDLPIRIMEYSNPVENRMPFPQVNYKGDIDVLKALLRLAKKEDIDIAVINEIPNADIAFAVRDLVNSAIGVITTTHINRVWHLPNKLWEFFGKDYKSIISQLNAVINQKMFRKWYGSEFREVKFVPTESGFDQFAYRWGVRKYYEPIHPEKVRYGLQPLAEILIFTEEIKTSLLNFDEMWRAEEHLHQNILDSGGTIESKLAEYINLGICSLDEMRKIY